MEEEEGKQKTADNPKAKPKEVREEADPRLHSQRSFSERRHLPPPPKLQLRNPQVRVARALLLRLPRRPPVPRGPPHVLPPPLRHPHLLRWRRPLLPPRRRHLRRLLRRRPLRPLPPRRPPHPLRPQLPGPRPLHLPPLPLRLRRHLHRRLPPPPLRSPQLPFFLPHRPRRHHPVRRRHPRRQARPREFRVLIPQSKPLSAGEVLACTAPKIYLNIENGGETVVVFVADGRFHLSVHDRQSGNQSFPVRSLHREAVSGGVDEGIEEEGDFESKRGNQWGADSGNFGKTGESQNSREAGEEDGGEGFFIHCDSDVRDNSGEDCPV